MAAESGRSDENVVINVESLVSSLEVQLKNAELSMPTSYCIFKTPSILFRHKPNSFCPNRFSIGPMHRGKSNLEPAERIKVKYLDGLLSRVLQRRTPAIDNSWEETKEVEKKEILSGLVCAVKLVEKQANACYEGHDFATILRDEFVETMVLDGVFIIELFRKDAEEVTREDDDPVFSMSCMLQFLHHDLILLENQIPWLVLETLFEKTKHPSETNSLIELALCFFATDSTSYPPAIKPDLFTGHNIKHILDLLRLSLVLPFLETKNSVTTNSWRPLRSATKLKQAGVIFKKVAPASILDIKFRDGILEIPSLLVQETTETIFRNLIAYEQCLPDCEPIFTCYAKVLDNLIDNPGDVEILCKKGIMDNWLNYGDSAQSFSKLWHDTFVKKFYYFELCNDLENYCNRSWPKWRAFYVQSSFTEPWAIVAAIQFQIM